MLLEWIISKKGIIFSVGILLAPKKKINAVGADKCTQVVNTHNSTISKGDFCCLLKTVFRFNHSPFRKNCWVRQTFCTVCSAESLPATLLLKWSQCSWILRLCVVLISRHLLHCQVLEVLFFFTTRVRFEKPSGVNILSLLQRLGF